MKDYVLLTVVSSKFPKKDKEKFSMLVGEGGGLLAQNIL